MGGKGKSFQSKSSVEIESTSPDRDKEVKIIVFILERGPGYESESVLSRSEAEWEIAKLLSDGWTIAGTGGAPGGEDLGTQGIGMGFVLMSRDITPIDSGELSKL